MPRPRWIVPLLALTITFQILTHLFWLANAAHVGGVAVPFEVARGGQLYTTVVENRAPAVAWGLAWLFRALPTDPARALRGLNLVLVIAITLGVTWAALCLPTPQKAIAALVALGLWVWWEPVYGNVLFYYDSVLGGVLLAAFVAYLALERRPVLAAAVMGLLLGLGMLVKQHGVVAIGLVGLWWLWMAFRTRRVTPVIAFGMGALVFPLVGIGWFAAQGRLADYLFWSFGFNLGGYMPSGLPVGSFVYKMVLTHIFIPPFMWAAWRTRDPLRVLLLALWLGGSVVLLPRTGEIHTMGMLPFTALISGWALADVWGALRRDEGSPLVAGWLGVVAAVMVGWLWAGAVTYIPNPLGRASIPAYDEFKALAEQLNALKTEGDTLMVLPTLDGNAQLYTLTDMRAPGVWSFHHACMVCARGLGEQLFADWQIAPPTFVVVFPDLITPDQRLEPLLEQLEFGYRVIDNTMKIPFNGATIVYGK